ncbi:MAG: hypothetical protein GY906_03230 [bacterium]|nr:hypothetical protein [bacterium]
MFDLTRLVLTAIATIGFLFFSGFAVVSLREHERRAATVAAALGLASLAPLLVAVLAPLPVVFITLVGLCSIGALILFWIMLPLPRKIPSAGGDTTRKVDERDVMFSRGRLEPGSDEFKAYYEMRPENLASDDRTRDLAGLMSDDAEFADPIAFEAARASFKVSEALRYEVNGPVADTKIERPAAEWTSIVKGLSTYFGAVSVGIAEVKPEHIYSNIGRGSGTWGDEIQLDHKWAIAFTVEMDHFTVSHAPHAPIVMESAQQYVTSAVIALQVATALRALGYPARAHIDGNYRVIAPLVARDAGLGELGRMGLLMTPKLGPRVRLGIVTTDVPLVPDGRRDDRSVLHFCQICKKCADCCPVGSIPSGDREPVEGGGQRWKIDDENCYRYWAVAGTDCGTCMRVCPYSHPDNVAHNLVRWAIRTFPGARKPLLLMDDLFYGRKPPARKHESVGTWTKD